MGTEGGDESAQTSPRNKVKFLCSHGGRILPRHSDGKLKYVGGETRVFAVPRDVNFLELMKKLSTLSDGDLVLKYQIISEDLDALVSVRSDEDLKHMFDEYDRHENEGTPKLRAFLFPSNPVVLENQVAPAEPRAIEQRYIDAINGVFRASVHAKLKPINAVRSSFSISSACSSPKSISPEGNHVDLVHHELVPVSHSGQISMHKVWSSPSLCTLNTHPNPNNNLSSHHFGHQHHHYYQNHSNYHPTSYIAPITPPDSYKVVGTDRLSPGLSLGRNDFPRGSTIHGVNQYYSSLSRNNSGNGSSSSSRCGCFDEYSGCGGSRLDRAESVPQSPRKNIWF